MSAKTWKDKLAGAMPAELEHDIDAFEVQLGLMKQGRVDEKLFAEMRLRRGVYGQRYDNGQRHDGEKTQTLEFPCGPLVKGPATVWDAPGMMRVKIPWGRMTLAQMDALAEIAEEYSDGILHVTTRQDIQLHYVHIEDTPDLMRRIGAVGITTKEACGNAVRNVTACPKSGVCDGESFDVTPYADALAWFLLGHPDTQDFGRKFKVAFSGCKHNPCGLTNFHDLGAIALTREVDGVPVRGFEVVVGGGLGAVPQEAKVLAEFAREEELLPLAQATSRVFARLGEKQNRSRSRIKFLVKKLGIEELRRLVREELKVLREDERWTEFLGDLHSTDDHPLSGPSELPPGPYPPGFERWLTTNTEPQRQEGYRIATVTLALGDLTANQMRALGDLARRTTGETVRTTVEQNLVFRWVSNKDLPAFYAALVVMGLADAGASTITDVTSCPGTDTCKLGISSSRGLSLELRRQLREVEDELPEPVRKLHIKASGCFNSCGQHHVADIGFLGVSRSVKGRRVPHFNLVVGGEWTNNGGSYGLGIGAIPSKNVPEVVRRLTQRYVAERGAEEPFKDFVQRIGKAQIRTLVGDLLDVPDYMVDPSFYSDWGDPREYTIGDMGVGECAGQVVPFVEFGLQAGEREVFEAQLLLEGGDTRSASLKAYTAMITVATALLRHQGVEVRDEDAGAVVDDFRTHFHDTGLFNDPFAGSKFAHYLFRAHNERTFDTTDAETARQSIEEAQLFVEAGHSCYQRMTEAERDLLASMGM